MERQRLTTLAQKLNAHGWNSQIITPSGQTLLRVTDPNGVAAAPEHIMCKRGHDDVEWYCWRQNRAPIAPADQPEEAANEVIQQLSPKDEQ